MMPLLFADILANAETSAAPSKLKARVFRSLPADRSLRYVVTVRSRIANDIED
jgi:hypothetical protein